jgi:hypothetical protein
MIGDFTLKVRTNWTLAFYPGTCNSDQKDLILIPENTQEITKVVGGWQIAR